MSADLSRTLNALGLLAVSAVLAFAFADQLIAGELPCPLCILQRVGFVVAGIGLALNLRFGARPSHYGVLILGAAATAAVSMRQVLLHIVPGTGSYGASVLEMHFYTWAFVTASAMVVGAAVMLLFDRQFTEGAAPRPITPLTGLAAIAFAVAAVLALANGVSTALECGVGLCPDNPTGYLLLPGGAGGD